MASGKTSTEFIGIIPEEIKPFLLVGSRSEAQVQICERASFESLEALGFRVFTNYAWQMAERYIPKSPELNIEQAKVVVALVFTDNGNALLNTWELNVHLMHLLNEGSDTKAAVSLKITGSLTKKNLRIKVINSYSFQGADPNDIEQITIDADEIPKLNIDKKGRIVIDCNQLHGAVP